MVQGKKCKIRGRIHMVDLVEEYHEEVTGGDHEEAIEMGNKNTHAEDQEQLPIRNPNYLT